MDSSAAVYARTTPETDLASPSFDAKQYLAVTHAVRVEFSLIILCGMGGREMVFFNG
jgi:hypothetical protein